MEPIVRSKGGTPSEKYLAELAERSFLDLWCYPNAFIDKGVKNGGDGKELCDLLVVCGDDVVIFSDKSIGWPNGDDVDLAWSRWYRRAVEKSVAQIRGAERWVRDFPDRVFLDRKCKERLPLEFPPLPRRRVHGVAIALGAQEACGKYFGGGSDGALMIMPEIVGAGHTDKNLAGRVPFAFGDVDPDGPFVHVFDETALNIVLREMDTMSDFVGYLIARSDTIRSKHLFAAPSEAGLLAVYLLTEDKKGNHHFPRPELAIETGPFKYVVEEGTYDNFSKSEQFKLRLAANKPSYVWDKLITTFTEHIIAGTTVEIAGEVPTAARAEPALRLMAQENRTVRRALGSAIIGALDQSAKSQQDRFTRVIVPNEGFADPECGYVFMTLAYPAYLDGKGGYDQYRKVRVAMLQSYCLAFLSENRHFKKMVGIAMDASRPGRKGGSEDMLAVQVDEWTAELEADVAKARAQYEILQPDRLVTSGLSVQEFPEVQGSRQQRRAAERAARKRERS